MDDILGDLPWISLTNFSDVLYYLDIAFLDFDYVNNVSKFYEVDRWMI